jgi:MFS family permease
MGGSGIYSMVLVIAPMMVPPKEYGKYVGIISSVFALASVVGPLVGGAISSHSTWRWVFLLK